MWMEDMVPKASVVESLKASKWEGTGDKSCDINVWVGSNLNKTLTIRSLVKYSSLCIDRDLLKDAYM